MKSNALDWFDQVRVNLPQCRAYINTGPLTPEGVRTWISTAETFLRGTHFHLNELYREVSALQRAFINHQQRIDRSGNGTTAT